MKKTMIYILALTLAFSTLLAGCGELQRGENDKTAPTEMPQETILPEKMMPDPADGEVRDRDGIITDSDSGDGSAEGLTPEVDAGRQTTGNSAAGTASKAKQ